MTELIITGNLLLAGAMFYNYSTKGQAVDYAIGTLNLAVVGVVLWRIV